MVQSSLFTNIAPSWPEIQSAIKNQARLQVVLLSRRPRGAMLLQHGPESGGHHGRGHGRGERS